MSERCQGCIIRAAALVFCALVWGLIIYAVG
jgi:hypothetical protein